MPERDIVERLRIAQKAQQEEIKSLRVARSFETCPTCGHEAERHYQSVTGVVRCLVQGRGITTSGVMGEPFTRECPCRDYVMA